MSNYVDWQGLDRGHEKYWGRSVWTGVLMALNECGGSADFLNENSAIYTILDEKIPQAEWHSTEADGSWRSNFRDAREPWTGLGVISFDETQMKLTENGRQLLIGEKTFGEIICETARTYSENNENPFAILASVFLGLPINQGLSIDDVVKIMRHYRPDSNDDLQNVLLGGPEEISDTAKRRLRHILRLLTFTGGIVFDSNAYYVASKRVLESFLVKTSFSLEETKKLFVQWLEINCRGSESFKNDMVKIIESWLDRKMPGNAIGNLFRFSNSSEYETEKARIMALPNFETVNQANQNGRPKTALNHYENFLRSINSRGVVAESIQEQTTKCFVSPFTPSQIIYYGVPGCGKSHTVDEEINKAINEYNEGKTDDDKISYEDQVTRVVFHPDYGNADFIGQIMPKIRERGGVDYIFKPGPFSQILRKAYLNSSKPYFLVIEEINRGNAAAIFGEMFQLLDRIKDNKKDKSGYGPGWSSYSILNDDVNDYIRDIKAYEKSDHSGCVKPNHPKDMLDGNGNPVDSPDANGKKEIDFSTATSFCSLELILQGFDSPQIFRESTAIRLPPNLSIYATMNTSDQNVFTLDNAFQRRWEMKQVPNKLRNSLPENATEEQKKELEAEIEQYNEYIGGTKEDGGTGVKWGVFRDEINKIIMRSAEDNGLSSMEDKRLGGWFIVPKKPDEKEDSKAVITKQAFAEKVLKYLWDDAFKFDRNSHFNFNKDEEPTLEKLIENFETKEFEIFVDPQIRELQKKTSPGDSAQDAASEE